MMSDGRVCRFKGGDFGGENVWFGGCLLTIVGVGHLFVFKGL